MTPVDRQLQSTNKERIRAAFHDWREGTGGPFGLLADDATWTIVGNSAVSGTYRSRQEFLDAVIEPFNARMSVPLRPAVREIFADGAWVIALFDASATTVNGQPYENTYTWYMRLRGSAIVEAIAFFDALEFNQLWEQVSPATSP